VLQPPVNRISLLNLVVYIDRTNLPEDSRIIGCFDSDTFIETKMYATGDFQRHTFGYTPGVQAQEQAVAYPSIVDEKQLIQSFDQTMVSNGQFNTRQPANLQYTNTQRRHHHRYTLRPEKTAYADPQLALVFNYPLPNPYINPQSSTAYPSERVHFELYTQPQPSSVFPPQGTPYTQPLPTGVYPPEKTGYSLISQHSLPPTYPPSISEKGIYGLAHSH